MISVDRDPVNISFVSEADNYPITITGISVPFCFPAITHIFSPARHQEIVHMGEEHIIAKDRLRSIYCRCEVNKLVFINGVPILCYLAIYLQSGNTSVRINVQSKMRVNVAISYIIEVLRTRLQG